MAPPATMQALIYTGYGGPEVATLVTLPTPSPGPGEVLVAVEAAALNPVDVYLRSGAMAQITPLAFPQLAGNELSGRVVALGAGVERFAVGDSVFARVGKMRTGALAQYVSVPAAFVAPAPTSVPLASAAGLPLAGLTALQMLDVLAVKKGDSLLIAGGATAVGCFAIQLAKARGARVTTTASPAGKALVERLGADAVIDYKATSLTAWAESNGHFDKVFDTAGPRTDVSDLLGAAGATAHIVTVAGPINPHTFDDYVPAWKRWFVNAILWARFRGTAALLGDRRYEYFFMNPDGAQLAQLGAMVDAGTLQLTVDSEYPLAEYADAFARLESGRAKGKIIVRMPAAEE
ncbi:hypothetical protein Q8F55_006378 [Vanrija albida]|uniref:Enoyl reductase (ER) domain-containing protein n=1 Tax=Vanrija albida TaxID=181172 RepID=A0ABR3PWW6_9TREE